jgi:hypothetical protein
MKLGIAWRGSGTVTTTEGETTMERKPKTLVMNIRFACPMESANVPAVLARIAGDEGHASLISTDVERGDLAAYKARHAPTPKAEPTAVEVVPARGKRARAAEQAKASKPGPVTAKRRAAAEAPKVARTA